MSKLSELGHDISRLSEIARIMHKYGFSPSVNDFPWTFKRKNKDNKKNDLKSQARQFTLMLEDLGPTFMKLGQILSTRGDLLPAEFIQALSDLQDKAPPLLFSEIQKQIETSLGKPLVELFAFIDERPLACASIAQVHAARLHDGSDVVVKVQRPGIKNQIERDSSMILMLAQLLEWIIEEASEYKTSNLATEFVTAFTNEIDFTIESNNLSAFRQSNLHRHLVKVPILYPEFSSNTIITMERIYGCKLSELQKKYEPEKNRQIIENLLDVAFEQLFIDGLFHADPHPGNILITSTNEIAFIDFGILGHISRTHQDRLLAILLSLSLNDPETLARQLIHLGAPSHRVQMSRFSKSIQIVLDRYTGLNIGNIQSGKIMSDIIEVSLEYKIHLPKEFALLVKATLILEGIVRSLHSKIHVTKHLSAKAESLLIERIDPRNFKNSGAKTALQLVTLLQDLPGQINQTLFDLDRGEIQITILSEDIKSINNSLKNLAISACNGFFSFGLIALGIYGLSLKNSEMKGWSIIAITLSITMSISTFAWSVWGNSKTRIPKFSLQKWRNKNKFNRT